MAKRMLIDAAHPEETRVVVLNGNRLEEFDFESSTKKQVKGNIYLAKVTRVEPSLQAAFVDYGNHRHGFLAFSEIHPDYYQIPVSDREPNGFDPAHEEVEAREAELEAAGEEGVALARPCPSRSRSRPPRRAARTKDQRSAESEGRRTCRPAAAPRRGARRRSGNGFREASARRAHGRGAVGTGASRSPRAPRQSPIATAPYGWEEPAAAADVPRELESGRNGRDRAGAPRGKYGHDGSGFGRESDDVIASAIEFPPEAAQPDILAAPGETATAALAESEGEAEAVETLGDDEVEEAERQRSRTIRHYKIQEVIKRRQIMLVQVTKEERGNKGAALTTYLSLAGRYCVLMPNTARGGGVSRKITSIADRRRLKDILEDLDIPEGMGVIVRTAGAERSKAEIKRDYEYLLRLWNEIRELTCARPRRP